MITIFTGSTGEPLFDQIIIDGRPFNLGTGTTVRFRMREITSDIVFLDEEADILDEELGKVSYEWGATDLDTPGQYSGWWHFEFADSTVLDTGEFLIVIDEHAPGVRTRTGAIYNFCRSIIPISWYALENTEKYGDALLQSRIEVTKYRLLGEVVLPEDEEDLDIRIQQYIAKLAVLGIIPAAIDYWMDQHETVSATGTSETTSFPERIRHLESVREQLTTEVVRERDEIEDLIDISPSISSNATPEFSPAIEEGFKTPTTEEFFDYAFPEPNNTIW